MFNEVLKLVCLYLISYGLLLILIELRAHLDKTFLLFGAFLIGMSVYAAIDFWAMPSAVGQWQVFWITVQNQVVLVSSVTILWYFVLISDNPHRRRFIYVSLAALAGALVLPFAPFFRVENNLAVPTPLYLFLILPLPFGIILLILRFIIRGLSTNSAPNKKRLLRFHLVGIALLLLCGIYDVTIFIFRLQVFASILPNSSILGLILYGGVSTIILTDRLTELVSEKNRYSLLADSDTLTDAGNRRMLGSLLAKGLAFADESRKPFSAIVLDIDSFKTYNDTFGHAVGDEILRQVASMVRASLRPGDALLRYGGDEFVVLCPDANAPAVLAIGERICAHIRETPLSVHSHLLRATVSVGCATYPTHTTSHDQLVNCADRALYLSKQNGKNKLRLPGRADWLGAHCSFL